jgi:hypothetical protein
MLVKLKTQNMWSFAISGWCASLSGAAPWGFRNFWIRHCIIQYCLQWRIYRGRGSRRPPLYPELYTSVWVILKIWDKKAAFLLLFFRWSTIPCTTHPFSKFLDQTLVWYKLYSSIIFTNCIELCIVYAYDNIICYTCAFANIVLLKIIVMSLSNNCHCIKAY